MNDGIKLLLHGIKSMIYNQTLVIVLNTAHSHLQLNSQHVYHAQNDQMDTHTIPKIEANEKIYHVNFYMQTLQ